MVFGGVHSKTIKSCVAVAMQYLFSCGASSAALVSVYENDTVAKGQAALGD